MNIMFNNNINHNTLINCNYLHSTHFLAGSKLKVHITFFFKVETGPS